MKGLRALALTLALLLALTGCARKSPYAELPRPMATITMSDGSVMRFELDVTAAPNTVANFIELANGGYYDGLTFFRVVAGVLIQSGDKNNDGTGNAGYTIQGEFAENGIENELKHARGVISMCRQSGFDTASSQFFIMEATYADYDGKYAAFGRAADEATLAAIDAVASVIVDGSYRPVGGAPRIDTLRVETYGYSYEAAKLELPEAETATK